MGLFSSKSDEPKPPRKVKVRGRLTLTPAPPPGIGLYYNLVFIPAEPGVELPRGFPVSRLRMEDAVAKTALATLLTHDYQVEVSPGHYHVVAVGQLCRLEGNKVAVSDKGYSEIAVARAFEVRDTAVVPLNLLLKPPFESAPAQPAASAAAAPPNAYQQRERLNDAIAQAGLGPEFVTVAWATDDRLSMKGAERPPALDDRLRRLPAGVHATYQEAARLGNSQQTARALEAYERGRAMIPAELRPGVQQVVLDFDLGRAKCLAAMQRFPDAAAVLAQHLSKGRALPPVPAGVAVDFLGTLGELMCALGRPEQTDRCINLAASLSLARRDKSVLDTMIIGRIRCLDALAKAAPPEQLLEMLDRQVQCFGQPHTDWRGCSVRIDALVKLGRLEAARVLGAKLLDHMRGHGATREVLASYERQVSAIPAGPGSDPSPDWMAAASRRRLAEAEIGEKLVAAGGAGDLAALEELCKSEFGPDAAGSGFRTALQMAACNGHLAAVKWLLDRGANLEATNIDSLSALLIAADEGRAEVVALLLERGARVDRQDAMLQTALHRAAWQNHREVVRLLLDGGGSVSLRDRNGFTALNLACTENVPEAVGMLLQKGASVELASLRNQTPLMSAAMEGHARVARLLLDAGARRDVRDDWGLTALDWAKKEGKREVQALLEG